MEFISAVKHFRDNSNLAPRRAIARLARNGVYMDFFEYASLADTIAETFGVSSPLWVSMTVGGLCFLIIYIFQSVGLYTIASRAGLNHKWMAFIPFFSTYYIGKCGDKNRFFNVDTKKIALATAILELVLLVVFIISFIATYQVSDYLVDYTQESAYFNLTTTVWSLPDNFPANHPELYWAWWCYNYLDFILAPLQIIFLLGQIIILNCFFQTYAAKHYFIFTLTSIFFPVQGILIFAVRNNKGMKYSDYIRMVQERTYRQYRNQQNFNQNPYNQNPYNQNTYSNDYNRPPYPGEEQQYQNNATEDPFSEFGSPKNKSGDPFDEFN